jgi:hypothetical protein
MVATRWTIRSQMILRWQTPRAAPPEVIDIDINLNVM